MMGDHGHVTSALTFEFGELVHVKPDLVAPRRIPFKGEGPKGLDVDIRADLVLEGRRYAISRLEVTRTADGVSITGELLRKIPVNRIVRIVRTVSPLVFIRRNEVDIPFDVNAKVKRQVAENGPTPENLTWIARVYSAAELVGEQPAKQVQTTFSLPASTASYWIRRAKDRGLLDDPAS